MFIDSRIITVICSLSGVILGLISVPLFNALPVKWLTDYKDKPDEKTLQKRIKIIPQGLILAVLLGIAFAVQYIKYGISIYTFFGYAIIWILMLTALSDIKYTIIPDQSVILLALLSFGFIINDLIINKGLFHTFPFSPVLGVVLGGGIIYVMGFIGSKVFKKEETMGFGDVKLLSAAGMIVGFPGILIVLLMTILISGLFFIFLIVFKKATNKENKPLGPHIALSCIIYILFYYEINWFIDSYFRLLKF